MECSFARRADKSDNLNWQKFFRCRQLDDIYGIICAIILGDERHVNEYRVRSA